MKNKELHIPLFDLVTCLSDAMDLISPEIVNHHKQVAYISLCIGKELDLPVQRLVDLVLAAAMHDAGALSLGDKIGALQFELENPHEHAEQGYQLFKLFEPFANIANIIRFHHRQWGNGAGTECNGQEISLESHIIHMADRISVLINKGQEIFTQVPRIRETIKSQSGSMFVPEMVEAFKALAGSEYFWLDTVSQSVGVVLRNRIGHETLKFDLTNTYNLTKLFSHIIDFRSQFTSNHSSGVAASAELLASLAGFSTRECYMMKIAGYLHDLGKLAVPIEIINKPGKLSPEEFRRVKTHSFYTYRILERIEGFEVINDWASLHHESLDGTGYPFHLKAAEISLGSRILAVADVFTALTEDRPYRYGMKADEVVGILQNMASELRLDKGLINLVRQNFDELNDTRIAAQFLSDLEYRQFAKIPV